VTLSRQWNPGDVIDVSMPFSFRMERAIDNPAVQSVFYGPTLMAIQGGPIGNNLDSGLLEFSFYKHFKLDGDFASAMTPADKSMHFTTNGHTLFPFYVADPDPSMTNPYHVYVKRHEPTVVFGSMDSGVPNRARADGVTFLDVVWAEAPFSDHAQLLAAVGRVSAEWLRLGLLTSAERVTITDGASRADLRA